MEQVALVLAFTSSLGQKLQNPRQQVWFMNLHRVFFQMSKLGRRDAASSRLTMSMPRGSGDAKGGPGLKNVCS